MTKFKFFTNTKQYAQLTYLLVYFVTQEDKNKLKRMLAEGMRDRRAT
jgi:hypothetical protein